MSILSPILQKAINLDASDIHITFDQQPIFRTHGELVNSEFEKATAEELSIETKRLRAVESASANQLVRMGYLKKKRQGHKVYFYIEQKSEENK